MNIVKIGEYREQNNEPRGDIIVLLDGDSIIHQCAHPGRDEMGNDIPEYTEDQYEIAEAKVSERLLTIFNRIEQRYNITEAYICIKGKGNFRYEIYPEYKANRKAPLPIIDHLCNWMGEHFDNVIRSENCEADDVVYTLSKKMEHKGLICSIDKDLKQIPGLHYDYNKEQWDEVTEEQARYNLAIQMCINDTGDGINFTKGFGIKSARKVIYINMSNYQYIKAIYPIYLKRWGEEAKDIMRLAYTLLKLKNINNE